MEYVEGVDCGSTVASAVLVLELQVDSAPPLAPWEGVQSGIYSSIWTSAVYRRRVCRVKLMRQRILDRLGLTKFLSTV